MESDAKMTESEAKMTESDAKMTESDAKMTESDAKMTTTTIDVEKKTKSLHPNEASDNNNSMGIVFCIMACFFAIAVSSVYTSQLSDFVPVLFIFGCIFCCSFW